MFLIVLLLTENGRFAMILQEVRTTPQHKRPGSSAGSFE